MIGVLDYGMGNVGSIINMLGRLGVLCKLISQADDVARCDRLILPGVGAFDAGISRLDESGLRAGLLAHVARGKPVLGICLGMQLLARGSEEGVLPGLNLIQADVIRFRFETEETRKLKIPHMGWNQLHPVATHPLMIDLPPEPRFYFVHSYHMKCDDPRDVIATVNYGGYVTAAVSRDNVYGAQFHPEKSHKFGMKILENFAKC